MTYISARLSFNPEINILVLYIIIMGKKNVNDFDSKTCIFITIIDLSNSGRRVAGHKRKS